MQLEISQEEKTLSAIAHLSPLLGYLIGFGQILIPLVILLLKGDSPYIREHAKESLNFQISMTVYFIGSVILMFVLVGFLLAGVLAIVALIAMINATLRAANGETYRYPICLRLVK